MTTLTEIVKTFNQFQVSAIQNEYNQWENPKDLKPIVENLNKLMEDYIKELEQERNNDTNK